MKNPNLSTWAGTAAPAHCTPNAGNLAFLNIQAAPATTTPRIHSDYDFVGVEGLLSRLGGVKKTGQGRWIAKCPTREDKTPSLSIRETEDGKILIHDFGGSDFLDILSAVGLHPIQLIPPHLRRDNGYQRGHRAAPPPPWEDALQAVAFQSAVIMIAAADIVQGRGISAATFAQVEAAEAIIQNALSACRGGFSK